MSLWLILIVVGVLLALLGFGMGHWLIWLGVVVLVVGLVLSLVGRSRATSV